MLLHIGYLKTGTTTLQHHVFSRLGRFIGKDGKAEDTVRVAAIDLLLGLTPKVDLPPADICSYEVMLRPGDMETLAKRTAIAFPMARKLFISIRKQDDLIWSQYLYDLKVTKARKDPLYPITDALDRTMQPCLFPVCTQNCLCGKVKKIPLPFYDFEYVRKVYAQHFDVLMLPMELMSEDTARYVDLLASFAGLDKPSFSPVPVENQGPDANRESHEPLLQKLLEAYAPSNRALDCPVDLSRYGYF